MISSILGSHCTDPLMCEIYISFLEEVVPRSFIQRQLCLSVHPFLHLSLIKNTKLTTKYYVPTMLKIVTDMVNTGTPKSMLGWSQAWD